MIQIVEERRGRKCSKEFRCAECGCVVPIGQRYHDFVLKGDDVYHWKVHQDCHELALAVDKIKDWAYDDCGEGRPALIENELFVEAIRFKDERLNDLRERFPKAMERIKRRIQP